jgi:hypothetical protein
VNRSAKYTFLGTGDFCRNKNEELLAVLKKMHEINGRVYCSETQLKVLFEEEKKGHVLLSSCFVWDLMLTLLSFDVSLFPCRKVARRPFRGLTIRWNLDHKEVKGTNIFMGDIQRSLVLILGDNCGDENLLKCTDGAPVDRMSFMFSTTGTKQSCISVVPNLLCCFQNYFKWICCLLT